MSIKIFQVDAFTSEPYKGNPAAVCILSEPAEDIWMRAVAQEMNLSETAFLHKREDGFNLRWFTPSVEVDLCGHATLASAHTLWEQGLLQPDEEARFHTRSGVLTARRKDDTIVLNFPATPPEAVGAPAGLSEALGVDFEYTGRSRFDYLVHVDSEDKVRALNPDFTRLKTLPVRGVMVTSEAVSESYDFVSRFFAPGAGVDEDPVTGSAHCCLGPFWSQRLDKQDMVAYQASARGGVLHVHVTDARVYLGGHAVTVLRGELLYT